MDRREAGKRVRRRQIVDAAIRILERDGASSLTMRRLAAEAGVSEATPYNLFESKAGVLGAVYQSVFDEIAADFAADSSDAATRLLDGSVAVARSWIRSGPWFRELLSSARSAGAPFLSNSAGPEAIFRADVEELRHDGLIGDAIDPDVLVAQLLYGNRGIYEAWIDGDLHNDALPSALRGSVIVTLLGVANPDLRQRLLAALHSRPTR